MLLQLAGVLFGQMNRQPPPPQGPDVGGIFGALMCYGVAILIGIVIDIFFLLTLSRCLAECSPRNRAMEPGMVWLNLIPLFSIVWIFITFFRITESLQNEYRSRGIRPEDPEFAKMSGILWIVLSFIPCLGIVGIVFFIIYWVKIAGYKNELMSNRGRGDSLEDDYDDRPRRRDRRDDDDDDRRRDDD